MLHTVYNYIAFLYCVTHIKMLQHFLFGLSFKVHQAKLQQTIQQQQENCSPDMLNVKAQGMISNSQVVQGSGMPQQEAGSKAQHIFGNCIMCGKFSLYLCSTCQSIWYCSQQCQVCIKSGFHEIFCSSCSCIIKNLVHLKPCMLYNVTNMTRLTLNVTAIT